MHKQFSLATDKYKRLYIRGAVYKLLSNVQTGQKIIQQKARLNFQIQKASKMYPELKKLVKLGWERHTQKFFDRKA